MMELRHIVCPVDFSEFSVSAYRYALSLARHFRARLFVQHIVELGRHPSVYYAPSAESFDEFCRTLSEKGKEQLQEFVKQYTHDEIEPECVVQQGETSDAILSFAEAQKADMIVMGTHGRRGFDRLMLGSATERVIRKASCPVLVVRKPAHDFPGLGKKQDFVRLGRILFCTDFSEHSKRALDPAISLTEEYKAELTLLHVLEDITSPSETVDARATAMEQLDKLIPPERRKTVRMKTEVRTGKPYQQIIQLALETQTDMVIMAVHGRGALDLAVFGSTTYRVIQLGPCPVLAVQV
jgi:nucleotide-binding universal stress UspA family protein